MWDERRGKAPINLQGLGLKTGIIRLLSELLGQVFCYASWVAGQRGCKLSRVNQANVTQPHVDLHHSPLNDVFLSGEM